MPGAGPALFLPIPSLPTHAIRRTWRIATDRRDERVGFARLRIPGPRGIVRVPGRRGTGGQVDAFFVRDRSRLMATALTRGPWSNEHQHGGPPAALLAGAMERAGDAAAQVPPVPGPDGVRTAGA